MKKRRIFLGILFLIMIVLNILVYTKYERLDQGTAEVVVTMKADHDLELQLFYINDVNRLPDQFSEENSEKKVYEGQDKEKKISFKMPVNTQVLRLDFGVDAFSADISAIDVAVGGEKIKIDMTDLVNCDMQSDLSKIEFVDTLNIEGNAGDPYIRWNISSMNLETYYHEGLAKITFRNRIIFCVLIELIFAFIFWKRNWFIEFGKNIISNKKLIISLSKNDFKTKYAGSYLGIFWAFVQPIVTVLLYWFVFEKGLKAGGIRTSAGLNVPFVLWLIAGLVPWFYFQDALNGVTNALIEYSYLVKKVVFDISILPVVKMISAIFVHAFFVMFMLVLYCALGFYPSIYVVQVLYYTFCVFALVLGLGYATCAIVIFFRDLTQVISIMLQVGTWMTPIMWNFEAIDLPAALKVIFKLNPMYYVVQGYRQALIDHVWFWQETGLTIYFWFVVACCFGLGMFMFRRLRVHFADVL